MTFKHTLMVGALLGIATLTTQAETVNINQNGSLVEMCASAEKQVAHDTAVMSVEMVATERDKVQAADKVNATMAQAVRMIKQKYPAVVFENANYKTYQERDEDGQPIKKWTVRQSYTLTSKKNHRHHRNCRTTARHGHPSRQYEHVFVAGGSPSCRATIGRHGVCRC